MLHYVDDFFFVGKPDSSEWQSVVSRSFEVRAQLGVPLPANEAGRPTTRITFPGIELDSVKQTLSLPDGKLKKYLDELSVQPTKMHCSRRELQSLVSKLQFAAMCVSAGRLFLRRMINLLECPLSYIIILNWDFSLDLEWWSTFLPQWNETFLFLPVN